MEQDRTYLKTYDLRRIVLFGATASGSLIFSVLFLLFLGSRSSSHHSGYSTDTISEMMGYAEFFLFTFASYFVASILVWRYADNLSRMSVSWLPITLFGSIAFSVTFLSRIWLSSLTAYNERNPFETAPPEFWKVAVSIVVVAGGCFILTSLGCGLTSAIVGSEEHTRPAIR